MENNCSDKLPHKHPRWLLFFRYANLGALSYTLNLIIVWAGTEFFKVDYLISTCTAYLITTIINFICNCAFVFSVQRNIKTFWKYITSLAIFYCLHIVLVSMLTELLKVHYMLSVASSLVLIFFIKFKVYDGLVFTEQRQQN